MQQKNVKTTRESEKKETYLLNKYLKLPKILHCSLKRKSSPVPLVNL